MRGTIIIAIKLILGNQVDMSLKTSIPVMAFVSLLLPAITNAQSVTVPTLILTVDKANIVANSTPSYNDLPTISWSSRNAVACDAFGTGWGGAVAFSGNQKVNPQVTTTYSMVCTGLEGSVTRSVTLTVMPSNIVNSQTASVIGGFDQLASNSVAETQKQSGFAYTWNRNLQFGSPYTADVSALQTALIHSGVYSGAVTGGFYNQTFAAVKRFQAAHGIESTGFVGPITRAELIALYSN